MSEFVTIATFNILGSKMDKFLGIHSEFTNFENRKDLVLRVINDLIEKRSIIHLQEFDTEWARILIPLFTKNKYNCLTSYNSTIKGRSLLGIATAYPLEYELVDVETVIIGHLINHQDGENYPPPASEKSPHLTPYQIASNRENRCIRIVLNINNKLVTFYNYHAPCAFYWRTIMTLHMDAFMSYIKNTANEYYVVSGDLNELKDSIVYNFLVKGIIPTDELAIPSSTWIPSDRIKLVETSLGKMTTWTLNSRNEPFQGALDHHFISDNFKSWDSYTPDILEPIPNNVHGSDHVQVVLTLEF